MKTRIRKYRLGLMIITVLITTSLACSLPFLFQDKDAVEISEGAAKSFEENMENTVDDLKETGVLELTITESEITSYIQAQLQEQSTPFFSNPEIRFTNDHIEVKGDVKQGGLNLPLKADLSVGTDGDGGIDYQVNSASIGPLKLPAEMLNEMTNQIEKALGNNISGKIPNLYIEEITIQEGYMLIKGHSR